MMQIFFFFQAEDGIRDLTVTGVQTCALPISAHRRVRRRQRPHVGAGVRLRCGRRLPALAGARRACLGRPRRSPVHRCVDRGGVGALKQVVEVGGGEWRMVKVASTNLQNLHQPPPTSFQRSSMKRTALTLALATFLATPLTAQWLGMPAWNGPQGGTGLALYRHYRAPNDNAGKGNAFGGRVALGVGTITLTAGVASWKVDSLNVRVTSYGGTAAFRLIGGSLIPVSVGLQLGAAHSAAATFGPGGFYPAQTSVLAAGGLSVPRSEENTAELQSQSYL